MDKRISEDAFLTKVLTEYQERRLAALPTEGQLCSVAFSEKAEKKMQKLIAAQKRPLYSLFNTAGKRIASIAVIVLLLVTVTVSGYPVVADAMLQYVMTVHQEGTDIHFPQPGAGTDELVPTYPAYIPDGYERIDSPENPIGKKYDLYCRYENAEGNEIWFQQTLIDSSLHFGLNTEDVSVETIYINGLKGIYYYKDDSSHIFWRGGDYCYYLSGDIAKDELMRMAESIEN